MPRIQSMPSTAYNRTISIIRDLSRMKKEYNELEKELIKASNGDGMPKGSNTDSKVEQMGMYLAELGQSIKMIEECLQLVPVDMHRGIMDNICYNVPFPRNEYAQRVPSLRTWQREKQKFIVCVAKRMHIYGKFR